MNTILEEKQNRDILLKYSQAYNLKKKKNKEERELEDKIPRYVIYARKSTEDSERQVQSIEDQIDNCKRFAEKNDLRVIDIFSEEKSAKVAGKRPVFNEILKSIKEDGVYDSILSWHPDRLARNMKEAGELLDMLDNDILIDLKFCSATFTNDAAGKMTLSILFAIAKEFSDKLSDDTKRGIKKKIKDGKYCGTKKKGYYVNDNEYFRQNDKAKRLSGLWKDALKGVPQSKLLDKYKDLDFNSSSLSAYLKDPFSAGIYCYGSEVVNITTVDKDFVPIVSTNDFLSLQHMKKNSNTWHKAEGFLPFREFIKCKYCGNYMTPGRSTSSGKAERRYLYISCGNKLCVANLKGKGQPRNTIRANIIVDFIKDYIKNNISVDEQLYNKVIKALKDEKYSFIKGLKKELSNKRGNLSKLLKLEKEFENTIIKEGSDTIITEKLKSTIKKINKLEEQIEEDTARITDLESEMEIELPSYNNFVNFFENIVVVIENTDDPRLLDQLVKFVFVNLVVEDKKVCGYELSEPFKTYNSLKFLSGVANGT